jgi:NADPH:quinone reductase-like Zn-dependent oxidoreductase
MPTTMNAVLLMGHGGFEQLAYRSSVPIPAPGPDEVLVQVRAAGVNNTDVNMRVGWYSKTVTGGTENGGASGPSPVPTQDTGWAGDTVVFPLIQGADVCGVVTVTGANISASRIGERVLVDPVLRNRPMPGGIRTLYLGSDCNGGFAEYVCVPAINAFAVKSPLTDSDLASFPCSYSAAENMLSRAGVWAGDTVLVTGASGGVGSAAVQLAKRRGATVIALAAGTKAAQVERLGASRVLPRDADLPAVLGRESVEVVIDVVGGPQFGHLLDVLRPAGRYAVAGAIAGPLVTLDLRTLYLKDLRLIGCTIPDPEVFPNLIGYIERREIEPVVSGTYPLREIAEAQRDFLSKRHTGKIVLQPELISGDSSALRYVPRSDSRQEARTPK